MGIEEYIKQADGKNFVISVDKFSNEDYWHGSYDTPEEALKVARDETTQSMRWASHASVATVYYAYTPKGKYLGGDTWIERERRGNRYED